MELKLQSYSEIWR